MSVEQINVITGLGDSSHIEVMGQLRPGDTVVIRGAERLSTGMTVVVEADTADSAGVAGSN
jgi:hypothetical protein